MRALWNWMKNDFLGIFREFRPSYLPPLMVYFAAGVWPFEGVYIYALDTETGKLIWSGPSVGPNACVGTILSNGRLFYTSQGGGLQLSLSGASPGRF